MKLSKLVGKRIKFWAHDLKYDGTFLGAGKKIGTNIGGLVFSDVCESIGCEISSLMMIHPIEIIPNNEIISKAMVSRAKEIFKENNCKKGNDFYYPPNQIKLITFPNKRETVLVVDDNASIRMCLRVELRKLGYSPTVASTTKEAFEVLECVTIDKIIIDLALPDNSGEALLFNVLENHPDIDIVIISGSKNKLSTIRKKRIEMEKSNVQIINKPCQTSTLKTALTTCGI
jgi:CheY-like chemotaxis protein